MKKFACVMALLMMCACAYGEDGLPKMPAKIYAVFKMAQTASPEKLKEAVKNGYNFNVKLEEFYDVNEGDDIGTYLDETPLHQAAMHNDNPESIRFLIEQGIDVNTVAEAGNYYAATPLSLAIENRNFSAIKELLKSGADIEVWTCDVNPTLFHIVASEYRSSRQAKMVIDALVRAGGNVNAHEEFTPEEKAELYEYEDPENFRVVWKVWDEEYPFGDAIGNLSHASRGNFLSSITPLMSAVLHDHPEIVEVLLDCGADPEIKSFEGKTAFDYALMMPETTRMRQSSAFERLKH